jgi:hypothetical protein
MVAAAVSRRNGESGVETTYSISVGARGRRFARRGVSCARWSLSFLLLLLFVFFLLGVEVATVIDRFPISGVVTVIIVVTVTAAS